MGGDYLRRFTDLTALIYLLRKRKITLLDPASWEDSNDSHYLTLYKEKRNLKSILALCFTESDERYHYWRVFAVGAGGVCVRFNRAELLGAVESHAGTRMKSVTYLTLDEIRGKKLKTAELPFLKRHAFEHECEFRMIYESKTRKLRTLDIPIPLSCVDKITLSPWMHPGLSSYVKEVLRSVDGCSHLSIVRSTLIGNEEWKTLGEEAK